MNCFFRRLSVVALCALLLPAPAPAVINVGLQPYDLYQTRYSQVSILEITRVDAATGVLETKIIRTLKGGLKVGDAVKLEFTAEMKAVMPEVIAQGDFVVGKKAVVFAGRTRRPKDLMVYAGSFFLGEMTAPDRWSLDKSGTAMTGVDGQEISTLAGTWNGMTDQLVTLLEDIAAGRDHFPNKGYARFQKDIVLDKLGGPVTGIAIYDVEGDGDEDIIATSSAGDRIFLQGDPMQFANATEALGLKTSSPGCSLADANADGLADLLAGAVLHLGRFENNRFRYERVDWLPADLAKGLKSAAFVELDGDGYPDVVASITGGGLRAFRNPGGKGGAFADVTEAMGLARKECGAGADGYFAPGDWNGDKRADLFYAAASGFLLVQDDAGVFQPLKHGIDFKFSSGPTGAAGMTGAGVFMPVLNSGRMDLVVPLTDGWIVVANDNGTPRDITAYGNEISEGSNDHLATIADDWNIDGHVDLFTVSQADNGHNRYIINRGYGSFMLATVHKAFEQMFQGPALESGGRAVIVEVAAGDGAPDLVIGGRRGHVTLIVNDTLATRAPMPHPPRELAVLEKTRLLTVRVMGSRGVVNARIRVTDANGRFVARRDLGMNVTSGNWDSTQVTFALRLPGKYKVTATYADGLERTSEVDLTEKPRTTINVDRGEKSKDDEF
jgi:FG-GAP-like repeat